MLSKAFEQQLETLGAFEVSSKMLGYAQKNTHNYSFLNAGRGNPNWIHTLARRTFAKLLEFGVSESELTMLDGDLAGWIDRTEILGRWQTANPTDTVVGDFMAKALDYCSKQLGQDPEDVLVEMLNGIVGNNYPVPSRCLVHTEAILNAYLEKALYHGVSLAKDTKVFPVEGGTAAIVYIFNALKHNGILNEGDTIAINMPIFTPYIQIPTLSQFELAEVSVLSTEDAHWEIPDESLAVLRDPKVKAFFLVNPSNPGSHALTPHTLDQIKQLVAERPDLIIITDDVYGTFVKDFQTVYAVAPHNTLLVYSFSKLYGCTGWRLGLIAMHTDNVFDKALQTLPADKKAELDKDYRNVTLDPSALSMIDRICADSRSIGLYHTSGLSTPQQIMMALFALSHLICDGKDPYFTAASHIVQDRYHALYSTLGVPEDNDPYNAKYYTLIDIYDIAEKRYGADFRHFLETDFEPIDFLLRLAEEEGVVLMEGSGFEAPKGTLRVSQANLPKETYIRIGERILELLAEYHDAYVNKKG